MKNFLVLGILIVSAFLIGCGGGGSGIGLDKPLNYLGYTFQSFNHTNAPTIPDADIKAMAVEPTTGLIYVGTDAGLYSFNPSTTIPQLVLQAGLPGVATAQVVNCLAFESSGTLLIGTEGGLYRRNNTTQATAMVHPQLNLPVLAVTVQPGGLIWVGMRDPGLATGSLAKFNPVATSPVFFTPALGMTASSVVNIYADGNVVYACGKGATGMDGLFYISSRAEFRSSNLLASGATIFFTTTSAYYAGSYEGGLVARPVGSETWQATSITDAVPYGVFSEIDKVWIATSKGLYLSFNMSAFNLFNKNNRLLVDNVRGGVSGMNGNWIFQPKIPGTQEGTITRVTFTGD